LVSARPDGTGRQPFLDLGPFSHFGSDQAGVITSLSPDGRWLLVSHTIQARGPLSIYEIETGNVFPLEPTAGEASWRPATD
jgi:hypothetical protein